MTSPEEKAREIVDHARNTTEWNSADGFIGHALDLELRTRIAAAIREARIETLEWVLNTFAMSQPGNRNQVRQIVQASRDRLAALRGEKGDPWNLKDNDLHDWEAKDD